MASNAIPIASAFCPLQESTTNIVIFQRPCPRISSSYTRLFERPNRSDNKETNNRNDENDNTNIDDFLDQQFFDPDQVADDAPGPLKWFANLVKNDYNTAEGLYVGLIFVFMVILSQELLRMQIYGDNYVPFQKGVLPGQLF
jgi:hypothetical protein